MSAKTNRLGSILGLLRTALIFGLAFFGIAASMNWFDERTSLDMDTAASRANILVNGYCHRSGSSICMPQLINVRAVPGHSKVQNMGWKFVYRLSPREQMQVDVDEKGVVQLASAMAKANP